MDLDRDGREPFWCVTHLLLHPAGCVTGTRLRDLKDYTLRGARWSKDGLGVEVVWCK